MRELYNKVSSSKYANVIFKPGDRIQLATPGGGGYGDPKGRDETAILEDVREGYVSAAKAATSYGKEIKGSA